MKPPQLTRGRVVLAGAVALALTVPAVAVAAGDGPPDRTKDAKAAVVGGKARNVILLLGDGMGDSEITIARNYQVGADGRLAWTRCR